VAPRVKRYSGRSVDGLWFVGEMKLGSGSPLPAVSRLLTLMILTLALFGCDYASKSAAKAGLAGNEAVSIAPGMLHGAVKLRYVENTDIAFNAFGNLGLPHTPRILVGLSSLAIGSIVVMALAARRRGREGEEAEKPDPMTQAGLALVIGGAFGNLLDRILRGYVIDFIHVQGWPVFNVADIAVVAGMGMFFLGTLRRRAATRSNAQ
jgi:signal peptidase II